METTSSSTQDNPDESGLLNRHPDADPRAKKEGEIHISVEGKGNIFSATGDVNIAGDVVYGTKIVKNIVQAAKIQVPRVIPYMVDREEVKRELRRVFKKIQTVPKNPLFCVLHGKTDEAHDQLLKRFEKYQLPDLLGGENSDVQLIQPHMPKTFSSREDLFDRIREALGEELANYSHRGKYARQAQINPDSSKAEMAEAMSGLAAPLMIASSVVVSRWGGGTDTTKVLELIDGYINFWKDWSTEFDSPGLFHFLVLQYSESEIKSSFMSRLKSGFSGADSVEQSVETYLTELNSRQFEGLHFAVMPKLSEVTLDDMVDWCRMTYTRDWPTVPEDLVSSNFKEYEEENDKSTMPMKIAGERLIMLLQQCNYEFGGK